MPRVGLLILVGLLASWPLRAETPSEPKPVNLPAHGDILDQGSSNFCGPYCLAIYARNWARGEQVRQGQDPSVVPKVDPAVPALAYNLEFAAGNYGTHAKLLPAVTQRWGVLPEGAVREKDGQAPSLLTGWRKAHQGLLDPKELEAVLSDRYVHPSEPAPFTPQEYRQRALGLDFSKHRRFLNSYLEPVKLSPAHSPQVEAGGTHYRYALSPDEKPSYDGSYARLKADGLVPLESTEERFDSLYARIVANLTRATPALVALHSGQVRQDFNREVALGPEDLVPVGQGTGGNHAITAVGFCGPGYSNPLCDRFQEAMKKKSLSEGIVFENSWGKKSHADGYLLVGKEALARMLDWAILPDSVPEVSPPVAASSGCRDELAVLGAAH